MSTIISVEHLTKTYRLGEIGGATLQTDFARWWARVRRRPDPTSKIGQQHPRSVGEVFWALDDVSFDVREGEVLGIIGRNGAGKSTLLKVLSQVTAPSSGMVKIHGRVASLLEVGTGFHPELTGRENIYLNGAILGMTKVEIRRKFDEIVAFSECEAFIETPVKRYSSGMYVRLAFAVAAHLEPEVLIVDEVLAVGDLSFQNKCLGKMRDVAQHGRTILFVSHNIAAVSTLCSRAILLADGRLKVAGGTREAIGVYQELSRHSSASSNGLNERGRHGTGKGRFASLRIRADDNNSHANRIVTGSEVLVEIDIVGHVNVVNANVAICFIDENGYRVVDVNTAQRGEFVSLEAGDRASVTFHIHDLLLKPGVYGVTLWLGRGGLEDIDYLPAARTFRVDEALDTLRHSETFPGVYQCRFDYTIQHMSGFVESVR